MRRSNYDKSPATITDGRLRKGWNTIIDKLKEEISEGKGRFVCVVECYQGVYYQELLKRFLALRPDCLIDMLQLFKAPAEVEAMTAPYLTDDRIFGRRAPFSITDFFDNEKRAGAKRKLDGQEGFTLLYGYGASVMCPNPDLLIYVDMARWEIQQRFRRKEINGLGVENRNDEPSVQYKRGYFIDWTVCDNLKKGLFERVDYWLDTHQSDNPKMIGKETLLTGLIKNSQPSFAILTERRIIMAGVLIVCRKKTVYT